MSIDETIAAGEVTAQQLSAAVSIHTIRMLLNDLQLCELSEADVEDIHLIRATVDRMLVAHRFPIIKKAV